MVDATFRQAPEPVVDTPKVYIPPEPKDDTNITSQPDDLEPIELRDTRGGDVVLDSLNINEDINSLPAEDKANLQEVKDYVMQVLKTKGLAPTVSSFKKTLTEVKEEFGLDREADPAIVLDRISGVVKAWRNLSFIKDENERRKIFVELAGAKTSKDMNELVYKKMRDYEVWQ